MPSSAARRQFLALSAAAAAGTLAQPVAGQSRDFGAGFVWGAATSSYQIEGSPARAGGGPSVWDTFCKRPGAIRDGSSGDLACDHISHWRDDVALMRELGMRAYRFSVSWPRVLPSGTGTLNAAGLDFYDRLVDALLGAGIEPWVTLFHWDYPEALHKRGGWQKEDSPQWFAAYATAVVKRLSDRVRNWMTFNEPEIFIILGYQLALHAPGDKLSWSEILRISHRVLLAHGQGTQAIRAASKQPCRIGCAAALQPAMPVSEQSADIDAARRATFSGMAAWLMEPMYRGAYPESELKSWERDVPTFAASDLRTIHQPLDFFAANIYQGAMVRAGANGQIEQVPRLPGHPRTLMDVFDVVPGGLYWGPRFYSERYKLPIVITENGTSVTDWIALDGKVHDPQRIDFMQRYLRELQRAKNDGADVRGYFAWSLMDNFEWAEGYRQRFGLIHVDFQSRRRTPKDAFYWYREVIRNNGGNL